MTQCTINPDDTVWDGFKQLVPDQQNLATSVEQEIAKVILRNEEADCLEDQHIEAAKYVLAGPGPGTNVRENGSQEARR